MTKLRLCTGRPLAPLWGRTCRHLTPHYSDCAYCAELYRLTIDEEAAIRAVVALRFGSDDEQRAARKTLWRVALRLERDRRKP